TAAADYGDTQSAGGGVLGTHDFLHFADRFFGNLHHVVYLLLDYREVPGPIISTGPHHSNLQSLGWRIVGFGRGKNDPEQRRGRNRNPGTDRAASEFPAKGAGNPWQSCLSRGVLSCKVY